MAEFRRIEKVRANVDGITEWWNRGLMHDGTISDILIDGKAPMFHEANAGALDVGIRFPRPLEKGEELTITLSFRAHNAFTKGRESVVHLNSSDVTELSITVELPRPCTSAELRQTYSGDHGRLLPNPTLANQNQIIEAKIKKPRMGASHHVDWTW